MSKAKTLYLHVIEGTLSYVEELMCFKKKETELLTLPPMHSNLQNRIKKESPISSSSKTQKKPPIPEIKQPKKILKIKDKKPLPLALSPLSPVTSQTSFQNMRLLFRDIFPNLYLYETPPTDKKAKRIKESFKQTFEIPEIPILSSEKIYHPFLNNIAKALTISFAPSKVIQLATIEKEKKWDLFLKSPKLKLILASNTLIFNSKQILFFYRENSNQKTHFLHQTPLFLLPDLSLYLKNPSLKRSLWNQLCQTLQPL